MEYQNLLLVRLDLSALYHLSALLVLLPHHHLRDLSDPVDLRVLFLRLLLLARLDPQHLEVLYLRLVRYYLLLP